VQEAPGFAVELEAAAAGMVGAEAEGFHGSEGGDGDDVPGVVGNDVGSEEVEVAGGVGGLAAMAAAGADAIGVALGDGNGLDLDAAEDAAGIDNEVVEGGVAVGFGDGEAQACGLMEESQFGEFSLALGVATDPGPRQNGARRGGEAGHGQKESAGRKHPRSVLYSYIIPY